LLLLPPPLQKWREATLQFEGVLGGCGGAAQPHALHVHSIDCRTPLLNCCNAAGDTKGALAHLTAMIDAMRAILGASGPRVALRRGVRMRMRCLSRFNDAVRLVEGWRLLSGTPQQPTQEISSVPVVA
jgi:hypothetical protein